MASGGWTRAAGSSTATTRIRSCSAPRARMIGRSAPGRPISDYRIRTFSGGEAQCRKTCGALAGASLLNDDYARMRGLERILVVVGAHLQERRRHLLAERDGAAVRIAAGRNVPRKTNHVR